MLLLLMFALKFLLLILAGVFVGPLYQELGNQNLIASLELTSFLKLRQRSHKRALPVVNKKAL